MKKIGAVFLLLMIFLQTNFPITQAKANTFWDFEYELLNSNTIEITKYTGSDKIVKIPESIGGKDVCYIGWNSFKSCSTVEEVIIPNTVTAIGKWAFSYCDSLKKVTLSENINSISEYAFSACPNLTEITFPSSLNSIGKNAFSFCSNLSKVTMPDSIKSIGEMAFCNCPKITVICTKGSLAEKYAEENSIRCITTAPYQAVGDVDGDGAVTSADALIIVRQSIGINDGFSRKFSDIDGDGVVTSADALFVLQMASSFSSSFF